MSFFETEFGFELKTDQHLIFFGKKKASLENLKKVYPLFTFKPLHQVHGNELLHSTSKSEDNLKGDAHWTEEKNLALISKSADCIPVLAYSKKEQKVLAIHAGWRGVQNRIIPKSFKNLGKEWNVFIGPHILKSSFDIQDDCFDLLKQSTGLPPAEWFQDGKADLFKIVKSQLKEIQNQIISITKCLYDTKTDKRFHSFRRDKDQAGRQNSFIVKI